MTFFCPACWSEVPNEAVLCPSCGQELAAYSTLPYEKKLLLALKHPVPEYRLLAIRLLGELRSEQAMPRFEQLMESEDDVFVLREVLGALSHFRNSRAEAAVRSALHHRSQRVRDFARNLLDRQEKVSKLGGSYE